MMKKIKMTAAEANEMMGYAQADGHIDGWNISAAGFIRYFDVKGRVWRDLVEYDFKRWAYAL